MKINSYTGGDSRNDEMVGSRGRSVSLELLCSMWFPLKNTFEGLKMHLSACVVPMLSYGVRNYTESRGQNQTVREQLNWLHNCRSIYIFTILTWYIES